MLTTWWQFPSNLLYLARRTTGLVLLTTREVGAALVPNLRLPADRIAWEAWTEGYLADLSQALVPPSTQRAVRTS
jgi:hypothetical protein